MLNDLILIRAVERTSYNEAFAAELREASGCDVSLLLDERGKSASMDAVSLNEKTYSQLGLYTPSDVAWRCGDYGIYMAWLSEPRRAYYWLIEDDVRIAGDIKRFFALCAGSSADFLCANLRPCVKGNFWWPHTQARDTEAWSCLFGTVRLSSRAVEACFKKRREHSRQALRRVLWPNDEGLVATTVAASGYELRDFNDLHPSMWDHQTYSVTGETQTIVQSEGQPHLVHPVRFAPRSTTHTQQTSRDDASSALFRVKRRVVRMINSKRPW